MEGFKGQKTAFGAWCKNDTDKMRFFASTFEKRLKQYFYIGGMPEIVASFVKNNDYAEVRALHEKIISDYKADFSKYNDYDTALKINAIFDSIPSQANASGNPIIWTSSNKNVATIDQGKVAATGAGTVTITAIAGDKTTTCDVTVSDDISQIKVSDDINGFTINGVTWATRNIDASGNFAAKPEDPGKLYQWNSKIAWPASGAVSGWVNADILASEWADDARWLVGIIWPVLDIYHLPGLI